MNEGVQGGRNSPEDGHLLVIASIFSSTSASSVYGIDPAVLTGAAGVGAAATTGAGTGAAVSAGTPTILSSHSDSDSSVTMRRLVGRSCTVVDSSSFSGVSFCGVAGTSSLGTEGAVITGSAAALAAGRGAKNELQPAINACHMIHTRAIRGQRT